VLAFAEVQLVSMQENVRVAELYTNPGPDAQCLAAGAMNATAGPSLDEATCGWIAGMNARCGTRRFWVSP
jgi:hypothetical protein